MNLDYLHTLVSVVEHGSLSAAARAKRISQPAVTKQVQRMESELGLMLLVRGPKRQAELTPAGERVLAFARETLSSYEELERELGVLKTVGQGTLVLAASTIPGEYVLPALLAAFREEYPRIRVEMSISDTSDVASKLLEDQADVGVIGCRPRRPGLRLERLVGDEVILAVPPGHVLANQASAGIDDLMNHRLILREQGSGTRRSVEEALVSSGMTLSQEDAALILGSTQAVLRAVEQGLGIGFVSARAAETALAGGRVARVSLEGIDLRRDLYLAYVPERAGDPLVGRFLKFARERFSD